MAMVGLPPGFRFHPTDEELVNYYLRRRIDNTNFHGDIIPDLDLYKFEPWDISCHSRLPGNEWYFFSPRDRKYPNGGRTNRATEKGYWKATGKDRSVYKGRSISGMQIGMKKTLVFYLGRAPRGQRTDWIMHEYRLESDNGTQARGEDAFVLCRVYTRKGDARDQGPATGGNPPPLLQGTSEETHLGFTPSTSPAFGSVKAEDRTREVAVHHVSDEEEKDYLLVAMAAMVQQEVEEELQQTTTSGSHGTVMVEDPQFDPEMMLSEEVLNNGVDSFCYGSSSSDYSSGLREESVVDLEISHLREQSPSMATQDALFDWAGALEDAPGGSVPLDYAHIFSPEDLGLAAVLAEMYDEEHPLPSGRLRHVEDAHASAADQSESNTWLNVEDSFSPPGPQPSAGPPDDENAQLDVLEVAEVGPSGRQVVERDWVLEAMERGGSSSAADTATDTTASSFEEAFLRNEQDWPPQDEGLGGPPGRAEDPDEVERDEEGDLGGLGGASRGRRRHQGMEDVVRNQPQLDGQNIRLPSSPPPSIHDIVSQIQRQRRVGVTQRPKSTVVQVKQEPLPYSVSEAVGACLPGGKYQSERAARKQTVLQAAVKTEAGMDSWSHRKSRSMIGADAPLAVPSSSCRISLVEMDPRPLLRQEAEVLSRKKVETVHHAERGSTNMKLKGSDNIGSQAVKTWSPIMDGIHKLSNILGLNSSTATERSMDRNTVGESKKLQLAETTYETTTTKLLAAHKAATSTVKPDVFKLFPPSKSQHIRQAGFNHSNISLPFRWSVGSQASFTSVSQISASPQREHISMTSNGKLKDRSKGLITSISNLLGSIRLVD